MSPLTKNGSKRRSNTSAMTDQAAVTEMFDNISPHYDYLNHLLSFGIDRRWRRKTSKLIAKHHPLTILDVATGTADLAIRLAKDNPEARITGIDLSTKMLGIGSQKVSKKKLSNRVLLEAADAASLPFPDNIFDAVTVAFGVRNFSDIEMGLCEMVRVSHDNGLVAILEFSHPTNKLVKAPYRWYSKRCIPRIGKSVSKHPNAYSYLPSSVEAFPTAEAFVEKLSQAGLSDIQTKSFSGGIATLYYGFARKNRQSSQ